MNVELKEKIHNGIPLAIALLFMCAISFILYSINNKKTIKTVENTLYMLAEEAYYEGQKDALEGDIRIELDKDSVYVWSKSPWNDDRKVSFDPKQK